MGMELRRNRLLNKFIIENDYEANIRFCNVQYIPIQMNDGVKLMQVLEGQIRVKVSFNSYQLNPGDFLLINAFELHSVESITESNKVIVIEMDSSLLENYLFAFDISFYRDYNAEIVNKVKHLMNLACKYSNENEKDNCQSIKNIIGDIAGICDQHFQMQKYSKAIKTVSPFSDHALNNSRMKKTYEYLYLDKGDTKRLDSLSEMMSIDKCYASRLIKEGMGTSFQELLNITRVEKAELLLLGTDLSIQNISEELNFSTIYYLGKAFKQFFGMSPQSYRKAFIHKTYPSAISKCEDIKFGEGNFKVVEDLIKQVNHLYTLLQRKGATQIQSASYSAMIDVDDNSIVVTDLSDNCIIKILISDIISKTTQ